ncbi:MAG: GspMb/PilO family protein [Bacillota bacterium]
MILSKRERYTGIVTAVVVGLFVIDHYALQPLLDRRAQVRADIDKQGEELLRATGLFTNKPKLLNKWNSMVSAGLGASASAAESQVLQKVSTWAQEAGLNLSSVKPEAPVAEKQFRKIVFRATGTGSMSSVAGFLWRIQSAKIPIRIADLQITPRKEGMDDLSLQIGISTVYLAPEAEKQPKPASPVAREEKP